MRTASDRLKKLQEAVRNAIDIDNDNVDPPEGEAETYYDDLYADEGNAYEAAMEQCVSQKDDILTKALEESYDK
jgi:hypothetical protein